MRLVYLLLVVVLAWGVFAWSTMGEAKGDYYMWVYVGSKWHALTEDNGSDLSLSLTQCLQLKPRMERLYPGTDFQCVRNGEKPVLRKRI